MSNDLHLDGNFTLNIPHFEGEFTENEQPDIQADFNIKVTPSKVSELENDLNYQTDIQLQEAIQAESDIINTRIDNEVERLEEEIQESSNTFVFEQGIPATEWVINHNLNKKPSVTVVDSADEEQIPDEKIYNTNNKVTLYFLSEFSGKAYLN